MTDLEKARGAIAHASRLAANGDTTEARLYLAALKRSAASRAVMTEGASIEGPSFRCWGCALDVVDADRRSALAAADAVEAELRRLTGES